MWCFRDASSTSLSAPYLTTTPSMSKRSDVCNEITTNTTAYFPSNDSYVVLPEAPHARYRHAAAAIGKYIYVFGGCDVNDNIVTAVDAFDVTAGVWKTLSQPFAGATSDNAGFVLDGPTHAEIYSVGG